MGCTQSSSRVHVVKESRDTGKLEQVALSTIFLSLRGCQPDVKGSGDQGYSSKEKSPSGDVCLDMKHNSQANDPIRQSNSAGYKIKKKPSAFKTVFNSGIVEVTKDISKKKSEGLANKARISGQSGTQGLSPSDTNHVVIQGFKRRYENIASEAKMITTPANRSQNIHPPRQAGVSSFLDSLAYPVLTNQASGMPGQVQSRPSLNNFVKRGISPKCYDPRDETDKRLASYQTSPIQGSLKLSIESKDKQMHNFLSESLQINMKMSDMEYQRQVESVKVGSPNVGDPNQLVQIESLKVRTSNSSLKNTRQNILLRGQKRILAIPFSMDGSPNSPIVFRELKRTTSTLQKLH